MKSAIMMFHLWLPYARSILHWAEPSLWSTLAHLCPEHLSNCACTCRTKVCFISQDYPGQKARYPPSTGLPCLPTRLAWILSEPACLSSKWYSAHMPISNPAQGRSARFGSTWSGGEVELVTLTNSGMVATQLLTVPLAPSWPLNRMLYEGP